MSAWRILEWSREHGRGAITSPHFSRVEFDGSCAEVDDFVVGETVHVQVEGAGFSLRVQRIWPDLPRFRAPAGAEDVPELDQDLRARAESPIASANGWSDMRVALEPDRVRLELDDDNFLYGPSATLEAFGPGYIELPTGLEPRFVRLADAAARRYLATRTEMTSRDIAVMIIDDERRFYFIVAASLAYTNHRHR
jgi:hypothetical protein